MAFNSLATWRTYLTDVLPNGASYSTTLLNRMLQNAAAYAGTFIRDVQRTDFVGDGVTRRFAISGTNVDLLDRAFQETPVGVGTAGVTAPSTAPALSAAAGGSLAAGLYYVSYSYTTAAGETVDSVPAGITVTASQEIVTGAITLPTGTPGVSPAVTGLKWYMSPAAGSADMQLKATVASGAAQTFATAAAAAAGRPLRNYTEMWTFQPQRPLEQDQTVDLAGTIDTSTLTLGTTPTLHARFRVVYECAPAIPLVDGDLIRVPEQDFEIIALMFAHRAAAIRKESGDTTQHIQAYQQLDLLVTDLQKKATPRPKQRPRIPDPST